MLISNFFRNVMRFKKQHTRSFMTFHNINHFGWLKCDCPNVPVVIQCIDAFKIPNGNMAFMKFIESETQTIIDDDEDLVNLVDADFCQDNNTLTIKEQGSIGEGISLLLEIPHNYNIDAKVANVFVRETEGKELKLISHESCKLGKIKSDFVQVISSGEFECKSLLGNGSLDLGRSSKLGKIQANHLDINTTGTLDISSCYCPQLKCSSTSGSINIGSLHGSSEIESLSGNVSILALDGSTRVQTESADISTTIESCKHVFLQTIQGNVSVGISDSVSAFIDASGSYIDVAQNLLTDGMKREESTGIQYFEGKLGSSVGNTVSVKTIHGTVSFERKDWFSKFNMELD